MSLININCPACRARYDLDENYVGRKAQCPNCEAKFFIERSAEEVVTRLATLPPKVSVERQAAPPQAAVPPPTPPPEPSPKDIQRAAAQVAAEWKVGDVILDLYEVKQVHEGGGMGLVYRVHHKGWNTDLAVKNPRAEYFQTEAQKENFTRECETWINLGLHPHIVSCHYVRTLGGIPRVFAEYVEGGSLKEWIDSRKIYEGGPQEALKRMLDIAIQFAWGLDLAHQEGLIHQDVKPANVMMTPDGIAKVTDFGLAKARADAGDASILIQPGRSMAVPGAGLCTREYASPEQIEGQPLTRRTDIWSWGVSVLEMFSGAMPPYGPAAGELLENHLQGDIEDESLPGMPAPLADLLRQCFQPEPDQRPKGMLEVAASMQQTYAEVIGSPYPREAPEAGESRADTLNNRAVSLYDLGRVERARQLLREAMALDPYFPEAAVNLALMTEGHESLHLLRRAVASAPGAAWPRAYLARKASGYESLEARQEALRLFPEDSKLRQLLEQEHLPFVLVRVATGREEFFLHQLARKIRREAEAARSQNRWARAFELNRELLQLPGYLQHPEVISRLREAASRLGERMLEAGENDQQRMGADLCMEKLHETPEFTYESLHDNALRRRNQLPLGSKAHEEAQAEVIKYSDLMNSSRTSKANVVKNDFVGVDFGAQWIRAGMVQPKQQADEYDIRLISLPAAAVITSRGTLQPAGSFERLRNWAATLIEKGVELRYRKEAGLQIFEAAEPRDDILAVIMGIGSAMGSLDDFSGFPVTDAVTKLDLAVCLLREAQRRFAAEFGVLPKGVVLPNTSQTFRSTATWAVAAQLAGFVSHRVVSVAGAVSLTLASFGKDERPIIVTQIEPEQLSLAGLNCGDGVVEICETRKQTADSLTEYLASALRETSKNSISLFVNTSGKRCFIATMEEPGERTPVAISEVFYRFDVSTSLEEYTSGFSNAEQFPKADRLRTLLYTAASLKEAGARAEAVVQEWFSIQKACIQKHCSNLKCFYPDYHDYTSTELAAFKNVLQEACGFELSNQPVIRLKFSSKADKEWEITDEKRCFSVFKKNEGLEAVEISPPVTSVITVGTLGAGASQRGLSCEAPSAALLPRIGHPAMLLASGLAIQGGVLTGIIKDVLLLDVIESSLAVVTWVSRRPIKPGSEDDRLLGYLPSHPEDILRGFACIIVERNTTLPTSKSEVFRPSDEESPLVWVRVLERRKSSYAKDYPSMLDICYYRDVGGENESRHIEILIDIIASFEVVIEVSASGKYSQKSYGLGDCGRKLTKRVNLKQEAMRSISGCHWRTKGELYARRGELWASERAFELAASSNPLDAQSWVGRARVLMGLKRFGEARFCLRHAQQLQPQSEDNRQMAQDCERHLEEVTKNLIFQHSTPK